MTTTSQSSPTADVQATDDFLLRPDFAEVSRQIRPAPPRYRNEIGKYSVRRSSACANCGRCVQVCPEGVHRMPEGYRQVIRPLDYRCVGPDCSNTDHYCVATCPNGALSVSDNPTFETLGDYRWTPDLLASNWHMAETGHAPGPHLENEIGASGGGFDRLRFRFPSSRPAGLRRGDISTELLLNRRERFPGKNKDRRPLVWRRHVVRFH